MLIALFSMLAIAVFGSGESPFLIPKVDKKIKKVVVDKDRKKEILAVMKDYKKEWKILAKTKKKQAKNFKKLKVWQKGIELVVDIYNKSQTFPKEEIYGLTSQIRRSSVSIPSNIAEGSGRNSDKEFNRFLDISLGSSFELETQLIIAHKLKFLSDSDYETLNNEIIEEQLMPDSEEEDLELEIEEAEEA